MAQYIPLTNEGSSSRTVPLEDAVVVLTTWYNTAAGYWYLGVADSEGNDIVSGLALVPGLDILKPHPSAKALLGSLVVWEKNVGDHRQPDTLGSTVILMQFAEGETVLTEPP